MSASQAELEYLRNRFGGTRRLEPPEVVQERARAAAGWKDTVNTWIGNHPEICLGAALAVGVTLGWLIKRR